MLAEKTPPESSASKSQLPIQVKLMAGDGEHVAIDVPQLSTFRNMVSHNFVMYNDQLSIFRIPGILYRNNEKAYSPTGFSIGPWHCRERHLQATQVIKVNYLEGLILRLKDPNLLGKLQEEIRQVEGEARKCYASPIDLCPEEFVNILVLDGCFIIELLLKYAGMVSKHKDPIFTTSYMLQYLYHDLILLENQVPWLVLELLFWFIEGTNRNMDTSADAAIAAKCKLIELTLKFFGSIFSSNGSPPDAKLFGSEDLKHILDLLRLSVVLPFKQSRGSTHQNKEWQPIPSASRLNEAGVKFIKVASNSILDVRFRHGALEMPALLVQETTETIFRNLIGYEQCLPNCRPVITSYAKLLDDLIDTTDDIELLGKKEVVDNWLSPDDATLFFNGLYKDAFVKEFFYPRLCKKLNHHCQRWWPKWRAAYVQNYFSKPWAMAAQIIALVMFVLTFLQTFFTIKK
ncbi:Protein of unknown function DUF247 [Theobroma cacao]|nr:Protein of unknown function DUF247 [Theobroma cacao]